MASPFYPGYYPGQRFRPPPRRGGRYPEGPLYEFKDPNDLLRAIWKDLESASDPMSIPRWIKDQMIGDLKRTMTVESIPRGYSPEESEMAELYGEAAEMPGAFGTSFNFNPVDWVKDPVKELKKFPRNIRENIVNFADVDLRNERAFWSRVLNGHGPLGLGKWAETEYQTAARTMTGKDLPDLSLTWIGLKKKTDRKVFDIESGKFVQAEVDAFDDVKTKYLDFINVSKSPGSRPGKYSAFRKSSIEAAKAEIEHFRSIGALSGLSRDQNLAVEGFLAKTDLALSMDDVSSGLNDLKKELSKTVLEGGGVGLAGKFGEVNRKVGESRNRIQDVRRVYGAKLADDLSKELANYERYLDKMEVGVSKVAGVAGRSYAAKQAVIDTGLKNALGVVNDQHQILNRGNIFQNKGDLYKGGIKDNYYDFVLERDLVSRRSVLGEVIDIGGLEGTKRLRRLNDVGRRKRDWEHGEDFISVLEKGNVVNVNLWNLKIRDRIQAWTPAYYVKEYLFERTHNFGAKISESHKVYGFWDRIVKSNKLFKNRFTLKLSDGDVKVDGGEHFGTALGLFSKLGAGRLGKVDVDATTKAISFADVDRRNDFIRFINAKLGRIGDRSGYQFDAKDVDATRKQLRKIKGLKKWLFDNKDTLGLGFDAKGNLMETERNFKKLEEIFRKVSVRQGQGIYVDVGVRFAGWMEKISSKLSFLQSEVFKRLGKITAPITHIKIAVSEAVSTAVTGLFEGATAGVGTALAPVVKVVTRYVVKKVMDTGEAVLKAFVKADFSKLIEEFDEGMQKAIKWIVAGCGCVFLPFAAGIMFVTTVILATLSPIDPTKAPPGGGSGGFGGAGSGLPPAPGPPKEAGGCPLLNYTNTWYSYYNNGNYQHGSDAYWSGSCSYAIPIFPSMSWACPSGSNSCAPDSSLENYDSNICYRQYRGVGATPYYGFALDVSGSNEVYVPYMPGVSSWIVASTVSTRGKGRGVILNSDNGRYKILLLHLNEYQSWAPGTVYYASPGASDQIGNLFLGYGENWAHVHIALMVDGNVVRPEDYLCH